MNIKIIGRGAWGKSIAEPLKENGHEVNFLGRGEIKLEDNDIIVLALPTNAIREVLLNLKSVKNLKIINCSKGIEKETHKLPFEIVQELTDISTHYFTLLGPSFASELQEKMPTLVNLGAKDQKEAIMIQKLFQTKYLRIHVVEGIPSLELAGVMKNICAIACGLAAGLGFEMNTRIKLIVTAIEEFYTLCHGLNFEIDERAIAGIIGDFMLTGSSMTSRNFQFGKYLVETPVAEVLQRVGATVEGYSSVDSLEYLINKAKVSSPLAEFVMKIVTMRQKYDVREAFMAFTEQV